MVKPIPEPDEIEGLRVRMSRSRALSAAVLPLVLLAGACGSDSGKDASSASSSTASSSALDAVTVGSGAKGVPTVTLKTKPFTVKETTHKVLTQGNGAAVKATDVVSADYLMLNAKDGKQLDTSYGKAPATMDLGGGRLLPGLTKSLVGEKVGSRVLVAMTPADAFGAQGNQQIGAGATDTILALLDIKSATAPLTTATGKAVAPKPGLPTVKVTPGKPAVFTIPKTPAPKQLVVEPLVQGEGAAVKAGQTLKAAYTGVVYADGRMFDSSASEKGGYREFPIGVQQVIPGWDKALVGQKIGSRVLIVVPPVEGYGTKGNPQAKIKGTDTLVFVVDILGAS
jgi:peptidylprolyl isomerase